MREKEVRKKREIVKIKRGCVKQKGRENEKIKDKINQGKERKSARLEKGTETLNESKEETVMNSET